MDYTFKNYQTEQLHGRNTVDSSFQTKEISSGKNSKYWILPDAIVKNLGNQWHYEFILNNIPQLKKYGIKESELTFTDEDSVRMYALSKGFTRMNYTINGGRLVIEAPSNNWGRKLKGAIYDFVLDNIDRVDYLIVRVLDSQGRPIKSKDFNWINSTGDQKLQAVETVLESLECVNLNDLIKEELMTDIQLVKESSLSRIWKHNVDFDCGAISAFRKNFTRKENDQRSKSLRAKLLSKGYSITQLIGKYPEGGTVSSEVSYFVSDIKESGKLFSVLVSLGEEFNQDSVLLIPKGSIEGKAKAYLYGTNKESSNWLGYHNKMEFNTGHLGSESPIYTSYVSGRPFLFESAGETIESPKSGFGMWALLADANADWEDLKID